ncbi:transposase [Serratia plymuthica]|nr:transposase [Serratia plymuthica]QQT82737.1 transposase [Serratia plymuthica]
MAVQCCISATVDRSQQHARQKITLEEMLRRYVSPIPARNFKMVRYYGFLETANRGLLFPEVYEALTMTVREKPLSGPSSRC